MEREVRLLADLLRIGEKMDRLWDGLSKHNPFVQERDMWQWVEKLPKFEGTGRRCLRSRSNKTIKF